MSEDEPTITVYSDYVCPFCYLGRRSLDRYLREVDHDIWIEWHPYDLRGHKRGPDDELLHEIDDGKDEAYFDRVRENVRRLKDEYGADRMRSIDDLPDPVDSFDAQVVSYYISDRRPELWADFDERIFEALWEDGLDIGDVDVLTGLGQDVGVDGDEIRRVLDDRTVHEELHSAFDAARRRGISGVPTFIYDGRVARGAVPPEHLARLVEGR